MIKSSRVCQVKGHEDYNAAHICTFQGCNLGSRWACAQCFAEQAHQHNQTSNCHIMNKQQFQRLSNQQQNDENQNNKNFQGEVQSCIQQIMRLLQVISQFEQYLQNCQKEIDDYNSLLCISLNNDQIAQILTKQNKKQFQFNNQELFNNVQQITKQLQEIEQSLLSNQQSKQQITNNASYEFKDYVQLQQNNNIFTAQISANEQYLAYGGEEKLCVIYDLGLNKEMKSIQLEWMIWVCQFSSDSLYLYIGCARSMRGSNNNPNLYCIDIANNCKQIYQYQFNAPHISYIKELKHPVIITIHSKIILITNIQLQQQIFRKQDVGDYDISGLDYDKLNNVIVSAFESGEIKFFNGQSGLLLIQKKQSQYDPNKKYDDTIQQIQLINDNKLASLSQNGTLKYWQVDYQNKELILLNQLKDEINIINFGFINQQQLIIIGQKYFKIFEDFKVVKQIEHSQNDDVTCYRMNQLISMNYVIINGSKKFTVMRRLQKNQ